VAPSDDEMLIWDKGFWERRRIPDWSVIVSSDLVIGIRQVPGSPSANARFLTANNGSSTIPVWSTTGPTDPDHPGLSAHAPIAADGASALSPDGDYLAVADAGSIYVADVASATAVISVAPIAAEP